MSYTYKITCGTEVVDEQEFEIGEEAAKWECE